ncbi:MAG: hypothetical protein UR26_C0002G0223 [candidate division TM6 bacterium GW2011_GWF2_32_72]|nr:MAG: hypothetical protein UR26_C0002G0223 [candidate division TM6 bacterium GW2011_GWF2_32_72]
MKPIFYGITSFFCLLFGMFFFLYYKEFIILNFFSDSKEFEICSQTPNVQKKNVQIIYWKDENWCKEDVELIWSENKAENIKYLINSWFTLVDEESALDRKISVESIWLNSSGNLAYISLDRNPFNKELCVYEKWMLVEGLLKTLRQNKVDLQNVRFLVHHKNLNDYHLDFANPWPVGGFLS